MVMTHLAGIADRIDRSESPRGGGEERELDLPFKDPCGRAAQHVRMRTNRLGPYFNPPRAVSLSCMVNMVRFLVLIANKNIANIESASVMPERTNPRATLTLRLSYR